MKNAFRAARVPAFFLLVIILLSLSAPWLSGQNPYDPNQLDIMNSELPPRWLEDGTPQFPLGTDGQGRDIWSTVLYGSRTSLFIGFGAIGIQLALGTLIGLISGYRGGRTDAVLMRIADIQLSFSTLMTALLAMAIARTTLHVETFGSSAAWILAIVIGLAEWPPYARTLRASVMAERNKDYIQAANALAVPPARILYAHLLPNTISPLFILAAAQLAGAILTEASLSFVGLGMPPNQPSLGSLIHEGFQFMLSGAWWMVAFPSLYLFLLIFSVNGLSDRLRSARAEHAEDRVLGG